MITEYYCEQYERLTSDPANLRFIVFEPIDRTGWGNRLRGLTLSFLFALATRRILVIKDFLLEENFDPPEGSLWRYKDWRKLLQKQESNTKEMVLHLQPSNWDQSEWEAFRNENMETLYPEKVIVLKESIGFFDQLIANPSYQDLWRKLGLAVESKIAWLGQITEVMLARPKLRLKRHLERFLRQLGPEPHPTVLVQFRTFYDIGAPQQVMLDDFIRETRRVLEASGQYHVLYVATDSDDATLKISKELSADARVIPSRTKVVHTGALHNGWEHVASRVLSRVFRKEFHFFDFWFWLPESWRPRPHTAVLAEWMFYGTCSIAISTFTSFTVYAMARTGNRADLYRFDPDSRRLEPLVSEKYFF